MEYSTGIEKCKSDDNGTGTPIFSAAPCGRVAVGKNIEVVGAGAELKTGKRGAAHGANGGGLGQDRDSRVLCRVPQQLAAALVRRKYAGIGWNAVRHAGLQAKGGGKDKAADS